MSLGLYFLFLSLFLIFFYNVHFITLLLLIELMLLGAFIHLYLTFLSLFGIYSSFFFLLVMVCMGSFGISLLVSISRFFGRDFWLFKFII